MQLYSQVESEIASMRIDEQYLTNPTDGLRRQWMCSCENQLADIRFSHHLHHWHPSAECTSHCLAISLSNSHHSKLPQSTVSRARLPNRKLSCAELVSELVSVKKQARKWQPLKRLEPIFPSFRFPNPIRYI